MATTTTPATADRSAATAAAATDRARLGDPARRTAGLAAATLALLGVAVASLMVGALSVAPAEVLAAFTEFDAAKDAHVVVTELRLPRTGLGIVAGAALGAAGALMQGVTRNPLAEPGILGINAGAAFAVVVAIFALGVDTVPGYTAFALAGAAGASALVLAIGGARSSARGDLAPVRLALAGAVLTALLTALTSAVLVSDMDTLDEFRFWIVGSIAGRDDGTVLAVAPVVVAGLVVSLLVARGMNTLSLGDDVARALGQRVGLVRAGAMAGFVLCAGGAVAAAGPIAFVGLCVPHVARALVGPDYRWVVPYSAVLGAILLLGADVAGRVVARPAEVEVGIVVAAIGAPFFIWLVRRRRLAAL